jgi:hypothetical protein
MITNVVADLSAGDVLMSPTEFCRRYPAIFRSIHALRWVLRDRQLNGLLTAGVVVEIYSVGSERPRLLIDAAAMFRWLKGGGSRGSTLTSSRQAA